LPRARKDRGRARVDRSTWIDKAIHLLLERPRRSLTMLLAFLEPAIPLKRATLSRELHRHPLWSLVKKLQKKQARLRARFRASAPHEIWQLDAKGSFEVRFQDGRRRRVTVLTIIDDFSTAVLGWTVARSEKLAAAVRVMRQAIARWGAPHSVYADRHSVYDSWPFRRGLALLGIHRIRSRPGNAPARGKIEAYHRVLESWFINELPHQQVVDEAHLEQLLGALIELVYHPHRHRGLRQSPMQALAGRRSAREVAPQELERVFWIQKILKAHPKTGELDLPGGLFRVPSDYAGQRVQVRWDPAVPQQPLLVTTPNQTIPLEPALQQPQPKKGATPAPPRRGAGRLQRLLDRWQGRDLPQAEAGYGLPEIFQALTRTLQRQVPGSEREAILVLDFYRQHGPLARDAFESALTRALQALGPGRPLPVLLEYLTRLVRPPQPDPETSP
ncbi:MAG: DDE-type integrase/transposase/recombinase, partial [Planctomycetota bacterium]